MKWVVILSLFAVPLAAPKKPDPLAKLPGSLRAGTRADYVRAAGGGSFRESVRYEVKAGTSPGRILLILDSRTGDLGPLTKRERIRAVFDGADQRVTSFTVETAKGKKGVLRKSSSFAADPKRKGGFLFERYEYSEKGKPSVHRRRIKPPAGLWAPAPLEPFLAALVDPPQGKSKQVGLLDVRTGRFARVSPVYRKLGEGKMKVGGKEVACRIFSREREKREVLVYRRLADGLLLKDGAARLRYRPEKTKGEEEPR